MRLLSLLQARREWTGASLSERLEVDVRTVRRDANRLRELGYVIESTAGPGGGYRLSAGAHTPPLLLDDAEAITVALALGAAAATMGNVAESALGVLVKLDQLLPSRLRRKWNAVANVTLTLSSGASTLDTKLLATIATACRDERRISFKYDDRKQQPSLRDVEPMRLVHAGRVWYLAAWDVVREDWRTFRLDRVDAATPIRTGRVSFPGVRPKTSRRWFRAPSRPHLTPTRHAFDCICRCQRPSSVFPPGFGMGWVLLWRGSGRFQSRLIWRISPVLLAAGEGLATARVRLSDIEGCDAHSRSRGSRRSACDRCSSRMRGVTQKFRER